MFEKLITNLKDSLPAPIRKIFGMAEETDNSQESDIDNSESQEDSTSSSSDLSDEEQKKKRTKALIYIV